MSYSQEIYDATRSRISSCDTGQAVTEAVRQAFDHAGHLMQCVAQEYTTAAHEQQRPSAIYRPGLSIDGDQWCALYGANLQDGVAGFGDSPEAAVADFDAEWRKPLKSKTKSNALDHLMGAITLPSITKATGAAQ